MLTLRLQREGKKRDFIFRIIAVDSRNPSYSGKAKEICGWYNPKSKEHKIDKEKIMSWIKKGAQPSVSCHNLLVKKGIVQQKKKPILIRKKKEDKKAA